MKEADYVVMGVGAITLGFILSRMFNLGVKQQVDPLRMSIEDVVNDLKKDKTQRIIKDERIEEAFKKNVDQDLEGNYYIKQKHITGEADLNTPKQDYYIKIFGAKSQD